MKRSEDECKLVVVVREDLKLSCGKMMVQAAHAAVSCAISAERNKPEWFEKWHSEGQKKVVVKVPVLQDLFELKMKAEKMGLAAVLIQDAGLTEVPPGTITCLGIGPGPSDIVDRITGSLKLL